jgi:hypothetical protein
VDWVTSNRHRKSLICEWASLESIEVAPSSINIASVEANDTDNDELAYEWELLPEPTHPGICRAGRKNLSLSVLQGTGKWNHQVPGSGRYRKNYRLFVYIRDGHGNIAVANVPFYVGRK